MPPSIRAAQAQQSSYCHFSSEDISQKQNLLQAAVQGNRDALDRYRRMIRQHGEQMRRCRSQTWPQNQAIWIRLYPCDARPGMLDAVLDKIVNRGYNQVYVEVFGGGQVMLPSNDNPTPWPSVVNARGYENRDLLAEAIAKGRERGLQVYAWMFSMNFGYTYMQRPGASSILAANGRGQNSLNFHPVASVNQTTVGADEVFIDPYNNQAKADYFNLVQAVVRRQPDGVLFDYIRYPRGSGTASVAGRVQDLWIYGQASQQALLRRATNASGQEIIRRFLRRGYITLQDVSDLSRLYPQDGQPLWQGINQDPAYLAALPEQRQPYVQALLWRLTVAHAFQGVLDFLTMASAPVQQRGIPAGAVFFPEGNQTVGESGYDSRLQPWDRFPSSLEWHPMAYGTCGNANCIVSQVQRVLARSNGARVMPVLAGNWGQSVSGRPALEVQMQAIRQVAPQVNSISHFAFSWQDPQSDRERKFCRL